MTILKKFHEIERGLIVGEVTIDGNSGSITTNGPLLIDGYGGIDINGAVRLSNSGDIDLDGYLNVLSEKTILHSLDVNNAVSLFSTLTVQENTTFQQDVIISGGDLITTNTVFNLLNTVAETINFGGYATTINIGKAGNTWIVAKSNLQVTNDLVVEDNVEISAGKFEFDGSVGDQGATYLLGTLDVGQDANFAANLDVVGITDLHSVTTVYDNFYVKTGTTTKFSVDHTNGNIIVYGTQNVKGAVDLDSTLNVDGTLNVEGSTIIDDTLNVTGNTDLDGTLNVDGTVNIEGATVIDDTLQVTGAVDFDSNLNVDGTLNVEGATTIDDTLNVTGNTDLDGTLNVDGNATLQGTLSVTSTISGSSTIADSKGEVRLVPQNTQASSYTLVAADHGKHILASSTVTVTGGIFSAGQTVVVINWTGGNITLSQGANMTMYQVGTSNTGNRTLAQRALVTLFFIDANNCIVSGSGLT